MVATRVVAFSMILAACLLAYSGPGYALVGNSFFATEILTKEDLEIRKAKGLELLENGKEGDSVEWSNPATKSSGTITLGESFNYKGSDCRRVELVNIPKGIKEQQVWIRHSLCKVPGQGWKYLN